MAKIYQFANDEIPFYANEEYIDAFIDNCFAEHWEEEEQDIVYREYYQELENELEYEKFLQEQKLTKKLARFFHKLIYHFNF